ncbi:hypothetical protein HY642_04520 [Candidatus Woesearchaeota archaeon]|nr:hypothetical protein [Candidatus Woesearchaeota archaeon]
MSIGDCGRHIKQPSGDASIDDCANAEWEGWPVQRTASAQYTMHSGAPASETIKSTVTQRRLMQVFGVFAGIFGVEAGAILLCGEKPAYGIAAMIGGAAITAYSTYKVMQW